MDILFFTIIPVIISIVSLVLLFAVLYFIYKSINTSLLLRKEQNVLLREILEKIGKKS
jgi:hypothetical protein